MRRTPATVLQRPGLEPRWHPGPGCRYFVAGDVVRLHGERGGRYTLKGFRLERGRMVAELVGSKPGRAPAVRAVYADRLRRP